VSLKEEVYVYDFLLLIVLVNLLLFDLDKSKGSVRALEAAIKVLGAIMGFTTNQANIHL